MSETHHDKEANHQQLDNHDDVIDFGYGVISGVQSKLHLVLRRRP